MDAQLDPVQRASQQRQLCGSPAAPARQGLADRRADLQVYRPVLAHAAILLLRPELYPRHLLDGRIEVGWTLVLRAKEEQSGGCEAKRFDAMRYDAAGLSPMHSPMLSQLVYDDEDDDGRKPSPALIRPDPMPPLNPPASSLTLAASPGSGLTLSTWRRGSGRPSAASWPSPHFSLSSTRTSPPCPTSRPFTRLSSLGTLASSSAGSRTLSAITLRGRCGWRRRVGFGF